MLEYLSNHRGTFQVYIDGARSEAEDEYAISERLADTGEDKATLWGRVAEHARKLALIHAISKNHFKPWIHVAANPFHADYLKFLEKLRAAPGRELPHSVLLKRMKTDAKTFHSLVTTLEQSGDLLVRTQLTAGRPARTYGLVEK